MRLRAFSCSGFAIVTGLVVLHSAAIGAVLYVDRITIVEEREGIPGDNLDAQTYDALRELMSTTTPSGWRLWWPVHYDEALIEADTAAIADYYRDQGYLDANCKLFVDPTDRSGTHIVVTITVSGIASKDRYVLGGVVFNGTTSIPASSIKAQFRSAYGDSTRTAPYFRPPIALGNLDDLTAVYGDSGFLDTTSFRISQRLVVSEPERRVDVIYDVIEYQPLFLDTTAIRRWSFNEPIFTDADLIRDEMEDAGLIVGRRISRTAIATAERRIFELGSFRRVEIELDTAISRLPSRGLNVWLSEEKAGDLLLEGGYETNVGPRVRGSIAYRNLGKAIGRPRGRARSLELSGKLSAPERQLRLSYFQPRFPAFAERGVHRWRVGLEVESFADWTEFVETDVDTGFTRELGLSVSVSKRIRRSSQLRVGYEVTREDRLTDQPKDSSGTSSAVDVVLASDTRNDLFAPTGGHFRFARLRVGNLLFNRANLWIRPELGLRWYRRLWKRLVGAVAIDVGVVAIIGEPPDPTDRFWPNDRLSPVRGYTPSFLSPRIPAEAILTWQNEVRWTL
ncbi:MAG: POTRA domain-containing protein, partial [Candidatus Latescibacteria bacterium]|nr:POTRA domain-containing protein [Candidatus Latescibacterota bacterium]